MAQQTSGAPPIYDEVEEKQDLAVAQQQPPPTGQIYPTQPQMAQQPPPTGQVYPTQPQMAQQQPPPTGQIYYAAQPQVVPGTVYQMPYQIPQMHQQIEAAVGKPPYPGPSDYLILSLVTMIMCGILNPTSLMIGIPGLVFAGMSNHHRTVNNNYHNAKRYSNYALGLVIANIIYTLLLGVILTGVAVGIGGYSRYGYGCYNCYGNYGYGSNF